MGPVELPRNLHKNNNKDVSNYKKLDVKSVADLIY